MSTARYSALPTSDSAHPQAYAAPTRESTAWFWDAPSVRVEVIAVESEPESSSTTFVPPSPQDAVFSNIPARTEEAEQLQRALADVGIPMQIISAQGQNDTLPQYYAPPAPSYGAVEEPVTLAWYLFKYGFCFPLFWLVGAFIIVSDLQEPSNSDSYAEGQPPSLTAPKSPYELELRREELALLRLAELKWAWRCAYAFFIWFVLVVVVLAVVIGTGRVQLF